MTVAPPLSRFDTINFGFASAEEESAASPQLLVKAFLDPMHAVGEATAGPRFLFLGSKGSGKSAIGLHL